MAKVRASDRKAVERRTGDPSFPMESAQQIESAIKLRGRGKSKSPGQVLNLASRAVSRLLKAGKISAETAARLRAAIKQARANDRGG